MTNEKKQMEIRLNLSEAVKHWGIYYPSKIAIDGEYNVSYGELNKSIYSLCGFLKKEIGKKQRIAILTDKYIPSVNILLGIIRSNNTFVLMHPNLTGNQLKKS